MPNLILKNHYNHIEDGAIVARYEKGDDVSDLDKKTKSFLFKNGHAEFEKTDEELAAEKTNADEDAKAEADAKKNAESEKAKQ